MEKVLICCLLCVWPISLVQSQSTMLFEELLDNVNALNTLVKQNVSELHSPLIHSKDCNLSVFKCFVSQSSLLEPADGQEDDFRFHLERIQSSLKIVKLNNTKSDCPPCNSHQRKSEKKFLMNFKQLLQRFNRYFSGKRRQ